MNYEEFREAVTEILHGCAMRTDEIASTLNLSISFVRRMLRRMKGEGIVIDARKGRYKYWALKSDVEGVI